MNTISSACCIFLNKVFGDEKKRNLKIVLSYAYVRITTLCDAHEFSIVVKTS